MAGYIHEDFYNLLHFVIDAGWHVRVRHGMASWPEVSYVAIVASPEPFGIMEDSMNRVEIRACWHTVGSDNGEYHLFDNSIVENGRWYNLPLDLNKLYVFVRDYNQGDSKND